MNIWGTVNVLVGWILRVKAYVLLILREKDYSCNWLSKRNWLGEIKERILALDATS